MLFEHTHPKPDNKMAGRRVSEHAIFFPFRQCLTVSPHRPETQGLPDSSYVLGFQVSSTGTGQELVFMVINGSGTASGVLNGQGTQLYTTITDIRRTKRGEGESLEQPWEGGPPQLACRKVQYDLGPVLFLSLHCWGENPSLGPQDLGYV